MDYFGPPRFQIAYNFPSPSDPMTNHRLRFALSFALLLLCVTPLYAADALSVASVSAPNGTVPVPVYVRDVSGTPLGVDQGAGMRIQGVSFRATFSPAAAVSSATFTRAGVLLQTPLFESYPTVTNGVGFVGSWDETEHPLAFTLDAAAPGNLIGYVNVTLSGSATPGTVVSIVTDPAATLLSNQGGTTSESLSNGALALANGSITVTSDTCTTFSSASASISGNAFACAAGTGGTATVSISGGGASPSIQWGYRTTPAGTTSPIAGATGTQYVISGADFGGTGTRYLVATVSNNCSQIVTTPVEVTITSAPNVSINASSGVYPNSTDNIAFVADQGAGATYTWAITNGVITSGTGTNSIHYTAGASGTVGLDVTVTGTGCSGSSSPHADVPIVAQPTGATLLHAITPCRIIDTRWTSPTPTPIAHDENRVVTIAGKCGIPSGTIAIAANFTVPTPAASGWLSMFPSDVPWPGTSTLNYRINKTRANNAIVQLSSDGKLTIKNNGTTVHFIIDVTAYFK